MNMNKRKSFAIILFIASFLLLSKNVFAAERACNYYAAQGQDACEAASYQGKKCEWDGTKKGGTRCRQSDVLTDEVKNNITSCTQITEHETCQSSIVNGSECIWRQGACYAGNNDGSNSTIIADDQNQRNEITNDSNASNTNNVNNNSANASQSNTANGDYVGKNICSEASVQKVLKLVGYILIIVKILIPLILIVLGTIDVFHSVVGKDQKDLAKSLKTLGMRVVLGIFIFFIPTIVNWAFDVFTETSGGDNNKQCVNCFLDPNNCGSVN